jgi:hypothetical protein
MSPSTRRLLAVFLAGLLVGVVLATAGVGAGGIAIGDVPGVFDGPGPDDPSPGGDEAGPDPDSPPASVAVGTGCLPTTPNAGWAHEVATGTSRTFTANLTVAHDASATVNATFETVGDGVYRLRVDVVPADRGGDEAPDCPTGSTVEAAASLPTAYDRVEVVVEGTTVGTMPDDGDTTADLRTFAWNATGTS